MSADAAEGPTWLAYVLAAAVFALILYLFATAVIFFGRSTWRICVLVTSPARWAYRKWRLRKRNKSRHPFHLCRHKVREDGRLIRCHEDRLRRHPDNLLPFCDVHVAFHRSLEDETAKRFRNKKYPFSELYHKKRDECRKLLSEELEQAKARKGTEGFIYVYMSRYDLEHQLVSLDALEECETFFYKIGFTTQTPYSRIYQQDNAVFPSGTKKGIAGRDYFAVSDALSAEQLVHAKLCAVRYKRFDQEDVAFEQEWFLTTFALVHDTMQHAARIVNTETWRWD